MWDIFCFGDNLLMGVSFIVSLTALARNVERRVVKRGDGRWEKGEGRMGWDGIGCSALGGECVNGAWILGVVVVVVVVVIVLAHVLVRGVGVVLMSG